MDVKRSRHAQAAIKWRQEGTMKGNFSASMEEVCWFAAAVTPSQDDI
jgi:hypothetical protein